METPEERVCCVEITQVVAKLKDKDCLVNIDAFDMHCRHKELLETCYKWLKQETGRSMPDNNRCYSLSLLFKSPVSY